MGLMDKLKGKEEKQATTAGTHGTTTGTHGTTTATGHGGDYSAYDGRNPATGLPYGTQPTGTVQEPYPTHGTTTGVAGSTDPYNATGDHGHHKTGIFGSKKHDKDPHHAPHHTVPTGGVGYNANAPAGARTAQDPHLNNQQAAGFGAHPGVAGTHVTHDSTTHSSGNPLTGGHSKTSSTGGGLFSKKDDLDDSLEKERKAKAELDEAIRRHEEARKDADGRLTAKEEAARAEFEAAERKLREAQGLRQQHGH